MMVKLGEVLTHRSDFITIDDLQSYKRVTAQLHAKGIILRDEVEGAIIKTKKQQVCKAGDFLVAEIDAKLGGFGMVPSDLEGSIVSSHYFLFEIDTTKLAREYLDFFIRTEDFQKQITARGSTNYAAIRPFDVLQLEIPLPLLTEQKRIVVTLERLMAKIEESRRDRTRAIFDLLIMINGYKNTLFSALYHEFEKSPLSQNADVAMGQSPAGTSYNELGIGYPLLNGPTEFGDEYPNQIQWTSESTKICKPGDLLICVRGATTGKMNWADKEYCIGRGLAAITSKTERCDKKYLRYFIEFQTQKILSDARGSTFPNLPSEKLKKVLVPIPPLSEQYRIVAYLDHLHAKVDKVKRLQMETEREMEALVPAILAKAFGENA